MFQNGVEELRKVSKYLGLAQSDNTLQQVLDKCSINNLKNDVKNKRVYTPFVNEQGESILYRKGLWYIVIVPSP